MSSKLLKSLCLVVWSIITMTQFALAGDSRGGGDVLPENLASKQEIRRNIEQIKPSLTGLMSNWEFVANSMANKVGISDPAADQMLTPIFNKLFNSSKNNTMGKDTLTNHTIFDEIKMVKFDIRETGSCKDLDGKEVDASAFNTDPMKICYSLDRLSKKLSHENVYLQILALSAHESSHRVGTNEFEAGILQSMALDTVSNKAGINFSTISSGLKEKLNSVASNVDFTLQALTSGDDREVCASLSQLLASSTSVQESYYGTLTQYGVVLMRVEFQKSLTALVLKSIPPMGYCLKESDPRKADFIKVFAGKSEISTKDFTQYFNKDGNKNMVPVDDSKVYYVGEGDKASLKTSLIEIRDAAKKLQESIQK